MAKLREQRPEEALAEEKMQRDRGAQKAAPTRREYEVFDFSNPSDVAEYKRVNQPIKRTQEKRPGRGPLGREAATRYEGT